MRVVRRGTLGLLLLVTADFLSLAPGAFSWESSNLFVDAVVEVARQRDAAERPAFAAPGPQAIEPDVSLLSGTSGPVVRERFMRGTLRPHIKRAQTALAPPSPSEDH
jgi:hypothetical protein